MSLEQYAYSVIAGITTIILISVALKAKQLLIDKWPSNWIQKREIITGLAWSLPLFAIMFSSIVIRFLVFGKPDPDDPPALEFAIFFVLMIVFDYVHNGVLFVVRKLKQKLKQWRVRMSERQTNDRSILVGMVVMVLLAPLGGFALVHLFPPECEPIESERIVDDQSPREEDSKLKGIISQSHNFLP